MAYLRLFPHLTFSLVGLGNTTICLALNYATAINAGIVAMAQPAATLLQTTRAIIAGVGVTTVIVRGDRHALTSIHFNTVI